MFTGIVETIGRVAAVEPLGEGRRLTIEAPWAGELAIGDSVAVDGACLTVVAADGGALVAEAVRETLARTTLGAYAPGRRVNLERALAVGDRLGGHFVQGHVDGIGTVRSMERKAENRYIDLDLPPSAGPYVAAQGSIAVNGVSLTVLEVSGEAVRLSIVPHTWRATTFSDLSVGDPVNVEVDLLARYLRRLADFD